MKPIRFSLIIGILLALSLFLHILLYSFGFSLYTTSNAIFIVGIIIFLPTLMAMTGSAEVFHGFNYAIRVLVSKNFHNQYPKFRDYKSTKEKVEHSVVFLEVAIASIILVVVGLILALVHMYG